MDGDETASKHSPESIFSLIDNVEDSKQKKYKKSGFEEFEGAWEDRVEPLLSCMNEIDLLYRRTGEVGLNDLKGKRYLLFVCIYFHSKTSVDFEFEYYYPQDFIPACHDLYSYRDDFEIVLVNSTDADPDYPFLFMYPLRHFPMSSIVVPFDDYYRRSSIRKLLDPVNSGLGFDFKCLFLDVAHKTMLVGEPNTMSSLVAHLKELVQNSSFDALRSYQRLLKNMWPVNSCLPPVTCPIARIFEHVKPEYSHDINAMVSQLSPIEIGQSLDVKMLLSAGSNELGYLVRKDGQQVEIGKAIQDKYLMICCFHAPVFRRDWDSVAVQSLLNIYFELYALGVDFEMVVVVKMKKLADYKQVFDHFLSAFPPSCFVIPFEDLKRRDFICNYLQLDYFQCLILDKKGTDMKKNILLHGNRFVHDYGADAFPFTDEKLQELQADEEPRWKTFSTNNLVGLLRCKLSDVLKKTNAEDGCGTVTISDLNNKDFVGLFLCVKGDLIPKLKEVYEHCKTHHKSFEILLVYMPTKDSLDPQNYKLYVDNQLQKHNLSLWYMPFDNSVSRKLYRLVCPLQDELIILGTQDGSVDPYGQEVLFTFGINAYPFTRKELVQREVNKFKELTLETLLLYESQSYLLKGTTKIPVPDLRGKNVLLWMSSLSLNNISFYHKLLLWYKDNRTKSPDFEVVFVRRHNSTVVDGDIELSEVMPWLVCPFIADHSASIEKKLFPDGGICCDDALVEFGTDGLVCSFTAEEDLLNIGVDESGKIPFGRSNLRRSAIKILRCHHYMLMSDYTD